jgi:hypothetical protein
MITIWACNFSYIHVKIFIVKIVMSERILFTVSYLLKIYFLPFEPSSHH